MPQARDEAGNVWEVDAQGNPVRLLQQAPPAQAPVDPAFRYEGQQAQANLRRTEATTNKAAIDARIAARTAPAEIAQAQAQAEKLRAEVDAMKKTGIKSDTERAKAITGYQSALALDKIIADLETKFADGPGSTSGLGGVMDYLPTAANQRFDKAANAARGTVGQALGFTGGQLNSAAEASMNIGPFIPQAGDKDGTIQDSIQRLRDLQQQAKDRSIAILGGVPDEYGNIQPIPEQGSITRQSGAPRAAGAGATETSVPIPAAMQDEYDAYLAQNGSNLDPQAYADFRTTLDRKYFPNSPPQTDLYLDEGASIRDGLRDGGTINSQIPATTEQLSGVDQFRNNIADSNLGAAAVGVSDAASLGLTRALAPEQMAALEDARPVSTTLGQVAGAVAGTGMIGLAGRRAAGALAPRLLGGQGKAQFGRMVAADTAYGAGYGGIAEGDALTGAALGAAGSVGGQAIGRAMGGVVGGKRLSQAAEALRGREIPLTAGQIMGGFAKAMEDKATSIPFVGDMVKARRMEGIEAFNREAFQEAGAPIGIRPRAIGQDGVGELRQGASNAYDEATTGAIAPFDQPFMDDMQDVYNSALRMPKDRQRELGSIMEARIADMADTGQMTGSQYQQAMRALKANRKKTPGKFEGFEDEYKNAITGTMDSLTGVMQRGGGVKTVAGLAKADESYRNMKVLEDATNKAAGGSQTDELFMFTPSQLQRAGMSAQKKFPGPRPMGGLADAGQAVLPSRIPNSGTADRAAAMMLPGATGAGILGGSSAAGYALDGSDGAQSGAMTSAAAMALLALGGTKSGQKLITKALADRPKAIEEFGKKIKKRRGLFGSTGAGLLIHAN